MSKELTPLQALEEIKDYVINGHSLALETEEKGFPLIEAELKETEKLRQINCELLEQKNYLREERDTYKKAIDILKGNISLEFIHPFKSVRYEVWLNRGDEEPILIANEQEEYYFLNEVFK